MDAVEHLARLDDAPGAAGLHGFQRVLAGAVDAGDADHGDGHAARGAERLPGALGFDAVLRPRQRRGERRVLVDPAAVMVAIDRDGREIDDCREPRRSGDGVAEQAKRRIDAVVGRDRDEQHVRLCDRVDERRRGGLAVEHDDLDAASAEGAASEFGGILLAAGGADDAREPPAVTGDIVLGGIAEAEAEQRGHARPSSAAVHSSATSASVSEAR